MAASPNNTVISIVGKSITDASGNIWTIANSGQVAQNGTIIGATSSVVRVAYVNSVVWHENLSGSWYSWNGTMFVAPAVAGSPLPTSMQINFYVSNGKIYDPDSNEFLGTGINITDTQLSAACTANAATPLLTLFPGLNLIRVPVTSYWNPASYATVISQLTLNGIVVELEHHPFVNNSIPNAYTGSDLTTESAWYTQAATYFKNNPRVWFGSMNEPQYYGPGGISDVTSQHVATYTALRNAGYNGPIMLCFPAGGNPGTVGTGGGMQALPYSTLTNIIFDEHFYPWMTNNILGNYTTDTTQLANLVAGSASGGYGIAAAATITSADGVIPLIWGETGPSEDGTNTHPNSTQVVNAVCTSGKGFTAWAWQPDTANNLTNGTNALTTYGTQVAGLIATAQKNAATTPTGMASPNGTIVLGTSGSFTDASGNVWAINSAGQVTFNGAADTGTSGAVELAYVNGVIWYKNSAGYWFGKSKPSDAFLPANPPTLSPFVAAASPDNTIVKAGTNATIIDTNLHVWGINSSGVITVDGAATTDNSNVVELAYEGGKIWQENSAGLWWYKVLPTDTWAPTNGTSVSPIPGSTGTGTTTGTRRYQDQAGGPNSAWNTPLGDGCIWGAATDADTISARNGGFINTFNNFGSAVWVSNSTSDPLVTFSGNGGNFLLPGRNFQPVPLSVTAHCVPGSTPPPGGDNQYNFIDVNSNPGRVFEAGFEGGGGPSGSNPIYNGATYSGIPYFNVEDATSDSYGEDWETGIGVGVQSVGMIRGYHLDPIQNPNLIPGTNLTKIQMVLRYAHDAAFYKSNAPANSDGTNGNGYLNSDSWPQLIQDYQNPSQALNYYNGNLKYGTLLGIPISTVIPTINPLTQNPWTDAGLQIIWALQHYGSISRDQAGGGYHLSADSNTVPDSWVNDANTDLPAIVKYYIAPLRNQRRGDQDVSATNAKNGPGNRLDSGPPPLAALNPPVRFIQSVNNTVVNGPTGGTITNINGDTWSISTTNQVVVNGVTDTGTSNVAELAYVRRQTWHKNTANTWYVKTFPTDTWTQAPNPIPTTITPISALNQTPTLTVSPNNTTVPPATAITDASGNVWAVNSSGQVTVGGTADTSTANVVELAYVSGEIWYKNSAGYWYGKTTPGAAWLPTGGTTTNPIVVITPSANNTTVPPAASITDANGHVWTITSGAQVGIDGTADGSTANVVELAYVNGEIWQKNTAGYWYGKSNPGDPYLPTLGTTTSPLPTTPAFTESSQKYFYTYASQTPLIYDSIGDSFGLVGSGAGQYQILQNGVVDQNVTGTVNFLLYYNHLIYYQNSLGYWYYKANAASSYTGPVGDPTVPTFTESPQEATITYVGQTPVITNGNGDTFALTGTTTGQYQILQNGVVDPNVTASVNFLEYFNHLIYYQDNTYVWHYKSKATDSYALSPGGDPRLLNFPDTVITSDALAKIQTPFTESAQNYVVNYVGQTPPIYDRLGEIFALTGSSAGSFQILQNGTVDPTVSAKVIQLVYYNHLVYYQDNTYSWYYKPSIATAYLGPVTDPRFTAFTGALSDTEITSDALAKIPTPFIESAQSTLVTAPGQAPIYDRLGEYFGLTGGSTGHYQILQNGAIDTSVPATVNELLYFNRLLYYQNSAGLWYSKANIVASYVAASGDPRAISAPSLADTAISADTLILTQSPFTESAQGTILTAPGQPLIYDRIGETFGLTGTGSGYYQILQNGSIDSSIPPSVIELVYYNRLVYYEDNISNWYSKPNIGGTYTKSTTGDPRAVSPTPFILSDIIITSDALAPIQTPFTESASKTRVTAPGQTPIYNRLGETFALSGLSAGHYQILQNGVADPRVSATVVQLVYYNQLVYYQDSSLTWYDKASISGTYVVSPIGDPTVSVFPQALTDTIRITDQLVLVNAPVDASQSNPIYVPSATAPLATLGAAVVAPAQVQPSAPAATTTPAAASTGQSTLLLDVERWDLILDANGNIAIASPPYATAQDAASAIRTFKGEAWYDTSQGIDYFPTVLGQQPPPGVMKAAINAAAMSVPDVSSAKTFLSSASDRSVTGQVQIVTSDGTSMALTGTLQKSPATDSSGNPLVDGNGNLIITAAS